eukprot:scaffold27864_cov90-Isochrysis_galbana.AAC.2
MTRLRTQQMLFLPSSFFTPPCDPAVYLPPRRRGCGRAWGPRVAGAGWVGGMGVGEAGDGSTHAVVCDGL